MLEPIRTMPDQPLWRSLASAVPLDAPPPPAPASAESRQSRRERRVEAFAQMRKALLGVISEYPGLGDKIAPALQPFRDDDLWAE